MAETLLAKAVIPDAPGNDRAVSVDTDDGEKVVA